MTLILPCKERDLMEEQHVLVLFLLKSMWFITEVEGMPD